MKLARPIERLSRHFDPKPLAADLDYLNDRDWIPLPSSGLGHSAVPLITVAGTPNHEYALSGPVRQTLVLERLPHLKEVIAALGVPVSRSRLIRLEAGAEAPLTVDFNYHWFRRVPLCFPIVTSPDVVFECGESIQQFAAGDVWLFDNSMHHRLRNASTLPCVCLIVETRLPVTPLKQLAPLTDNAATITLEPYRFEVLTYEEVVALTDEMLAESELRPVSAAEKMTFGDIIERIRLRWKVAFDRFGHHNAGELAYEDIILDLREQILPKLAPTGAAKRAAMVMDTMLRMAPSEPRKLHRPLVYSKTTVAGLAPPTFHRPVIVVAAPRSGSTLLFDLLAQFPHVWTIGGESHACIRGIPELHPAHKGYESDRLTAEDATPSIIDSLVRNFAERLVNREGHRIEDWPDQLRFVEKTPSNALRIPFLRAVFPDALFVYLQRDPKENISSLVEGWRSRRFIAYRAMPDWPYRDWSFLLPPGWRSLAGRSLVEIAAFQWHAAKDAIEKDLEKLPASSWCNVNYAQLVHNPRDVLGSIAKFAGFDWDIHVERAVTGALPLSRVTISAPSSAKWLRHEEEITKVLSQFR